MSSYCLNCKQETKNLEPRIVAKSNRQYLQSRCASCNCNKSKVLAKSLLNDFKGSGMNEDFESSSDDGEDSGEDIPLLLKGAGYSKNVEESEEEEDGSEDESEGDEESDEEDYD